VVESVPGRAPEATTADEDRWMPRRIVVNNSLTLDGVMQAPGDPDEDRRGGFEHGGWANAYFDPVMAEDASKGMAGGGAMLFGRRTYAQFATVWPNMPSDNMFANVLNESQKYVASRTLREPLDWQPATLLRGDAANAIAELKAQDGPDIVILGSGDLIRSLMPHHLIDEYRLLIHPLVLGSGIRLFTDDTTLSRLRLVDSKPTTTGVIIATYRPE
jgi:dihydrofolate reductase